MSEHVVRCPGCGHVLALLRRLPPGAYGGTHDGEWDLTFVEFFEDRRQKRARRGNGDDQAEKAKVFGHVFFEAPDYDPTTIADALAWCSKCGAGYPLPDVLDASLTARRRDRSTIKVRRRGTL